MWMVCVNVCVRSDLWACACGEMHDAGAAHFHPRHPLMSSCVHLVFAAWRWLAAKLRGVVWSVRVFVECVGVVETL